MLVNFWCMRHGERDGEGNTTERGLRQVEASAKAHLAGQEFDIVFHSGWWRAEQAARRAAVVLDLQCPIVAMQSFDYSGTSGPFVPHLPIEAARQQIGKPHGETTAYDWLEKWGWPAGFQRGQMRAAMLEATIYLMTNPVVKTSLTETGESNVLVTGHSPGLEMAADKPSMTTSLNLADIICYEVEVDKTGFVTIRSGETYRCPPVE